MGKYDKDRQAGRADASAKRYRPPTGHVFCSDREMKERAVRREHYKEGYHDKKRQMGQ